ncbi:hypothetical protein HU200_004319 [Digitaria exilis]|uniref:ATPase AAA-type core domain-containing protein n=1 Tax=Digitaria exilis TaxID=1010633 RepID=A0A835FV85_9POAL|nr:hypothetical protein HU200_004319 [Digitaria exilis]
MTAAAADTRPRDRPRRRDRPRHLHALPPNQEQRGPRRRPRRRQDGPSPEGLAQRIATGTVPAPIAGARVVEIDVPAMLAGTTYRGMFEERMKGVIKEAEEAAAKVILFIDEMHTLLGAGRVKDSNMDAANMLKPALARGRIRCVGATTFEELPQVYRERRGVRSGRPAEGARRGAEHGRPRRHPRAGSSSGMRSIHDLEDSR